MIRGKLRAMSVPWMVSPSVPEMRISIVENGHSVVLLDAAVLPSLLADSEHLANRGVEVQFEHGQWVRTHVAASDANVLPRDLFDWSAVEFANVAAEDVDGWTRAFRAEWMRRGDCPDPRFYEVLDSRWVREENAQRFGCRHFVLVGHDLWMEVLCTTTTWRWKNGGPGRLDPSELPRT